MVSRVPKEKRDEIIGKAHAGEKVMALSSQYGINSKTIYYWLRSDTGEEGISVLKYNKLKRENEELKRLIGELTLDLSQGKKS